MIEASAPGKLFIAGEYAVVEPGQPAILVAVDQFITVQVETAKGAGSLRSFQYGDFPILWRRVDGKLVLDKRESTFHYLLAAIETLEAYAMEQNVPLALYHLTVDSELDSQKGLKYGLGSSAAVTVATIRALCRFYGIPEHDELVYKLSVLSQLSLDSNGSFGDVVASVYTGWITYTSLDRKWVREKEKSLSLTELLKIDWPGFSVTSLIPPEQMHFVIGWTGSPASTAQLVDEVKKGRYQEKDTYETFLNSSKACVLSMTEAFINKNLSRIQEDVRENRRLLKNLGIYTGVQIETPALTLLCDLAESIGGAAKSSGAGGGDCGLVFFDSESEVSSLIDIWGENNIEVLPLSVYTKNKRAL